MQRILEISSAPASTLKKEQHDVPNPLIVLTFYDGSGEEMNKIDRTFTFRSTLSSFLLSAEPAVVIYFVGASSALNGAFNISMPIKDYSYLNKLFFPAPLPTAYILYFSRLDPAHGMSQCHFLSLPICETSE
jgi:hypothetical protein